MTTEIQVPVFPLASRCSICRLFQTHNEQFLEATQMLMLGEEQQAVAKWLNKHRGIDVTIKSLSRHYHNHMLPYFAEALELERRLRAEMAAMDPDTPATIASALARSAAMRLLTVVGHLNLERLAANADPKLLDSISRAAETIAKIDALGADRKLKEKLIELRTIELMLKEGRVDQIAHRFIVEQLRDSPEEAAQVLEILDRAATKQLKALTSGSSEPPKKKNASTKRSKGQKSSSRSRRPKR